MPAVPVCLLEPLWAQISALLPERPRVSPTHPLGCHRPRIADRVVFEHVVAALVHGAGYERIASPGCSEGTIRRRLKEGAAAGVSEQVHTLALQAYDRMLGLELDDLAVDGCVTKAPGPLLGPTLTGLAKLDGLPDDVTVHLDRGYDGGPTRALLDALGFDGAIARKGLPAPVQAGARWVVERTHQGLNGFGTLRRCTQTRRPVVDFYLFLAAALVVLRQLIQRARLRYRWATRPTARRLK